jgi:hypothetical protein
LAPHNVTHRLELPGLLLCTALHSGHVRIMSPLDLLSLSVLAPMNTSSIMLKALIVND